MKFVVGKEGSFVVSDRAFVTPECRATSGKKIPESIGVRGSSKHFTIKRGIAQEWRDVHWGGDGALVYGRVLPEDAEPELAEIDEQIAVAESELKQLRAARQMFLAAAVVRGERITKKHVEAQPPEPPKEPPPPPSPEEIRRTKAFVGGMNALMREALGGKGGA